MCDVIQAVRYIPPSQRPTTWVASKLCVAALWEPPAQRRKGEWTCRVRHTTNVYHVVPSSVWCHAWEGVVTNVHLLDLTIHNSSPTMGFFQTARFLLWHDAMGPSHEVAMGP
jgi:hypothetical protein